MANRLGISIKDHVDLTADSDDDLPNRHTQSQQDADEDELLQQEADEDELLQQEADENELLQQEVDENELLQQEAEENELLELEQITKEDFDRHTVHRHATDILANQELVDFAPISGGRLSSGQSVELIDGDFLRISTIIRNKLMSRRDSEAFILRGTLLRRQTYLDEMLPKKTNELAAIIIRAVDDNRSDFVASLEDRPLTAFLCIREVIFTNIPYPAYSFRGLQDVVKYGSMAYNNNSQWSGLLREKAMVEARLVCRTKYVTSFVYYQGKKKLVSNAFRRILPHEASQDYSIDPIELLKKWRGLSKEHETPEPKYTMIDLFCGSGGVSEAAKMAGLHVQAAVDNKKCAAETHQLNHRRCNTLCEDVTDFIAQSPLGWQQFDILHSSNPCRYWSFQHTTAGRLDEMNEALAYTAEEAAKKFRPRILTFEQTPGFCVLHKHQKNWRLFIRQLTSLDFDVEWRICNLADYNNPHARKRLIIFASCPGQQLPDFPKPTHGPPGSDLRPYVTVNDALRNIPRDPLHNRREMLERQRLRPRNMPRAEGNAPLKRLIDTSGPHVLHPYEDRQFTVREVLRLQGFPDTYQYVYNSRSEALAMAGDAVPPTAFKPFLEKCKEALQKTDKDIATYRPTPYALD